MDQVTNQSAEQILTVRPGKPLDLHGPFLALLRGARLIVLSAFLCGLLGYLYTRHLPVTYRAQVEVLPPQSQRSSGVAALSGTAFGEGGLNALSSAVQTKNQLDSFQIILQAWPLQAGLVKRFHLAQAYNVPDDTKARYILASRTKITGTREGFVLVDIIDTDAHRAATIANGYVDQAREFLRSLALSEASQRRAFYEGQLAAAKDALVKAEESFRHMQQTSGMFTLDAQTTQLISAAATLHSQITEKELEIQSLRNYSTASNPQVQMAESDLAALRGQLARLESHGEGGLMGKALTSVPGAELAFVRATRELKYQESLYDLMVKQYEGSKLDEARDAPTIQVIEPALVPDRPFGPHKARVALICFASGFALAVMFVLFRYARKNMSGETANRLREYRNALRGAA